MPFPRLLDLSKYKSSAFLFGPRMTGKTTLLRLFSSSLYIDLLDPEIELQYEHQPHRFWEALQALPKKSVVVVDEIQRVPLLLNYIQKSMEEQGHRFLLSGSSARKLRRGGVNLLGGRALDLRLHPLTADECQSSFSLDKALSYGTLPRIVSLWKETARPEIQQLLRSYYTTYIKEEIQAEALTRNIGAFQRFLQVAAESNAQVIEFATISRVCQVPMSTVKGYYEILEDTLLGDYLWPWGHSERHKARPKFYFFDPGVVRALQNRLQDPPTSSEKGFLFETWFVREVIRHRDYAGSNVECSFWRDGGSEIDLLLHRGAKPLLAIECKTTREELPRATRSAFQKKFPKIPLLVCSSIESHPRQGDSGIEILPWKETLERVKKIL